MSVYKILRNRYYSLRNNEISIDDVDAIPFDNIIFLEKKINEVNSLDGINKIYFDKTSDFPRFKLSNFTSIKKLNSSDEADCVVYKNLYFDNPLKLLRYKYSIRDLDSDIVYLISEGFYNNTNIKPISSDESQAEKIKRHLIETGMTSRNLVIDEDITLYKIDECPNIMQIAENKKIISDANLDLLISKNLIKLDDESFKSIDSMLSSNDSGSIEIGVQMICNLDYFDSPFRMLYLIRKNGVKISNSKKVNSIVFKNLINSFGFSKHEGTRLACFRLPNFTYFDMIKMSKPFDFSKACDEDKEFAKNIYKDEIYKALCESQLSNEDVLEALNVDLKITI